MGNTFMQWRAQRVAVLAVLLAMALGGGCGSPKFAPVSGRVTINGQPAEGIIVYFSPAGSDPMNAGVPSRGRTSADGRYALAAMEPKRDRPGALIGNHTVTLDDERTFEKLNTKSRVPTGWQATFEVTPQGAENADFTIAR